jgi:hypothetical protein
MTRSQLITSRDNISWRGWVFWAAKGTGGLQHHIFLFLMENSILKIFGSMDVKITPDFCSNQNSNLNLIQVIENFFVYFSGLC